MSWITWLGLAPAVFRLVAHVAEMLRDGRMDDEEIAKVGADLVQLVQAVIKHQK